MKTVALSGIVFFIVIAALAAWADRRATPQEIEAHRLSSR
jgi:hypothetical protein